MHIQERDIDEFIVLYKKHYGKVLTRAEALEKGHRVLSLIYMSQSGLYVNEYEGKEN